MMDQLLVVPKAALPHLISVTDAELTRQRDLYDRLAADDWPDDFDAHDILLFADVLEQLTTAERSGNDVTEFSYWKGLRLLMRLIQKDHSLGITVVARR